MAASHIETTGVLRVWLWVAVAFAVGGALLLYPIGTPVTNVAFIIVKIGMVTGLLVLLLGKSRAGFWVWAIFSLCAVVMTIIKCVLMGGVTALAILSMVVDIAMPIGAILLMPRNSKVV